MKIEIFTDGSATIKEKPGGWACVLVLDGKFHSERYGYLDKATNNDAELAAAIKGLETALELTCQNPSSFPQENEVILKSDSELVLGWANGTYRFKQTEKIFLYETLSRLMRKLNAKTEWVPGHSGVEWNERCDELANKARLQLQIQNKKEEAKVTGDTLIGTKKEGTVGVWYEGILKIIDLQNNVCEDYNREIHGKRGSAIEIRKDKL